MSINSKRGDNGNKGESRTESILLDEFWVLKRSADVGGGDFLVQNIEDDLEKLYKPKILGYIQAKFFENWNEVLINADYIEDENG